MDQMNWNFAEFHCFRLPSACCIIAHYNTYKCLCMQVIARTPQSDMGAQYMCKLASKSLSGHTFRDQLCTTCKKFQISCTRNWLPSSNPVLLCLVMQWLTKEPPNTDLNLKRTNRKENSKWNRSSMSVRGSSHLSSQSYLARSHYIPYACISSSLQRWA